AKRFELRKGTRNVSFNQQPDGTYVTARFTAPSYAGSFLVTLSGGGSVTVGAGVLTEDGNGAFSPYIGSFRADGVQTDGSVASPPSFQINGSPNKDLESWIVIQCPVVQATGQFDLKKPSAMQ